ncbi:MAG: hypothetical protein U0984_06635, partial [Prosthecobacter sp.]|nr:hypothetical protein [Prosthecobacter sp.]
MKPASLLTKSALCLVLAGIWSGCDRTPKPAPEAAAPAKTAPAVPVNPLLANAARFGMAGRMPKDTGAYLGSANFKAHREALQKTQYWKTLEAFLQDSKPSAEKEKKTISEFEEFPVDDFFLAMGKDSTSALGWLIDVNHLYGEYTYRTLITGFTGGPGKQGSFDPQAMLSNASTSPELIERLCALMERAELPPLILGVKTAKPEALMEKLFPAKGPIWVADLKKGSLTINTGATLTTYEGTVGIWLTQKVRDEWLKGLGQMVKEPALIARIKKTLDTLAAKKFSFAVGISDGYLIAAAGNDLRHVQFAATPADSLLSRPELAVAEPHAGKDLLGLLHVEASALTAMHDDQPLTPMLQGALNGLAGTPVFSALTKQLEPKLAALTAAEKDFYRQRFATAVGVLWWEKGVHMELSGGVSPEGKILGKPLKFAALLDTPEVLFAAAGHSPVSVTGRAYFERWMDLLYTTTGGFIQAGLGGDQALGIYALADKG